MSENKSLLIDNLARNHIVKKKLLVFYSFQLETGSFAKMWVETCFSNETRLFIYLFLTLDHFLKLPKKKGNVEVGVKWQKQ